MTAKAIFSFLAVVAAIAAVWFPARAENRELGNRKPTQNERWKAYGRLATAIGIVLGVVVSYLS